MRARAARARASGMRSPRTVTRIAGVASARPRARDRALATPPSSRAPRDARGRRSAASRPTATSRSAIVAVADGERAGAADARARGRNCTCGSDSSAALRANASSPRSGPAAPRTRSGPVMTRTPPASGTSSTPSAASSPMPAICAVSVPELTTIRRTRGRRRRPCRGPRARELAHEAREIGVAVAVDLDARCAARRRGSRRRRADRRAASRARPRPRSRRRRSARRARRPRAGPCR